MVAEPEASLAIEKIVPSTERHGQQRCEPPALDLAERPKAGGM
jgi:hypothetical protein